MAFPTEDRTFETVQTVSLATLKPGIPATLHKAELPPEDVAVLAAMGIASGSEVRVCKRGEPWIVQSGSTRIGLTAQIAQGLQVVEAQPA